MNKCLQETAEQLGGRLSLPFVRFIVSSCILYSHCIIIGDQKFEPRKGLYRFIVVTYHIYTHIHRLLHIMIVPSSEMKIKRALLPLRVHNSYHLILWWIHYGNLVGSADDDQSYASDK